jgi:iron(III) transport system permease protein
MATAQEVLQQRGLYLWQGLRRNLFIFFAVGFALWLIIFPLIMLILFSFREGTPWTPGALTLSHYIHAYSDPQTYTMLFNTALIALSATTLSLSIAVFFAYLTERTDMPFRNVAWGLMLLPMAIPSLLSGISWVFLLSPRIGVFNVWLRSLLSLFGLQLAEGPINLYSVWGMIFLMGLGGSTTIFLMIAGAFRTMDPNLEEAARVAGAPNRVVFFRVFLPMLKPILFAAFMYSFMIQLETLEIPMVVGLPGHIYVFSSYIYFTAMRLSPPQYGLSAALGVSFLIVSLILVYWYRHITQMAGRFATVTGKGYRPRLISLGRWRYPALGAFLLYFILTILAPTLILLWRALTPYFVPPTLKAISTVTLDNFRRAFAQPGIWLATKNTIVVGLVTATLTMLLATVIAWVIIRMKFKGRGALDGISFLPLSTPGVIIALALIFLYLSYPMVKLPIYGSVWIIILGLTAWYLAFGTRTMNGAIIQIHRELEEAANICGARWLRVMRRILVPLILPAFISGWIWVAAHSLRTFSIPLLLTTKDNELVSVLLWHVWDWGLTGVAAAMGVMLIGALLILTVGGRLIVTRVSRRE